MPTPARVGLPGVLASAVLLLLALTAVPAQADDPSGEATDTSSGTEVDTDYGRMMLVLDSSGSMAEKAGGSTKIDQARQALATVIDALPEEAYVGLRVFGSEVFAAKDPGACQDTRVVVEPGTDNRAEMEQAVASYKPYGETPIPAALRAAAADIGGEGKRSIVLVSDGESTCSPDPCQVAADIAADGVDVQIDVVGMSVSGKAREQLQCVAEKGGGTYYDAADAAEMESTMTRISERAMQPYAATGDPVTGTENISEAPVLTEGTYADTMPVTSAKRFYLLDRTIPGSTLRVGLTAQPYADQSLDLTLSTGAGAECGSSTAENDAYEDNNRNRLLHGAVLSSEAAYQDECFTSDQLVLTLEVTDGRSKGDTPLEIVVGEEPPLASYDGLPPAAEHEDVLWDNVPNEQDPVDTGFGSSFADAVELEDNAYRRTIVPGEIQLFRVPLDWGQRLQTEVRLHAAPKLADVVAPDSDLRVELYDPYRADADLTSVSDVSGDSISNTTNLYGIDDESRIGATTAPVRYLNRETYLADVRAADTSGDYYVAVQLSDEATRTTYELTYDLIVSRPGTAGEGAPDYAEEGLATPVPSPSASPTEEPTEDPAAPTEEPSASAEAGEPATATDEPGPSTVKLVAAGSLGTLGVAALLGAGVLLLLRSRRRSH
ncbi:VWA domain-containing protein [Nocardioides insulae]|uniref:VWA domain-containing protein n=1 Tax=Nocardioides insulae TaxID=394734 RepID=UPI0003F5D729|nr:VWA domain-containing protein [Nocardioides insulae]